MQLLKIGGEFDGGMIVSIVRAGVTVRKPDGTMVSYTPAAVEAVVRQMAPPPRRSVPACRRQRKKVSA